MTQSNKCILIAEASSSQTTLFSYNSDLSINKLEDKPKFILNARMHQYAIVQEAQNFYDRFFEHPVVKNHLYDGPCAQYDLHILATGGMRNIKTHLQDNFYDDLREIFIEKNINLKTIRTISSEEEARYAWLTIKILKDSDCHFVFDLGGETGQITGKSGYYSDNIGKGRAIDSIKEDKCYNDLGQYNGEICRTSIRNYIENSFGFSLSIKNDACALYAISNFYLYFNDVCNSYLPYIASLSKQQSYFLENLCHHKDTNSNSMPLKVREYVEITDRICEFWNNDWQGNQAYFAKDACFSGNYNYQMLKVIGLDSEDIINVDKADWALGAAYTIL